MSIARCVLCLTIMLAVAGNAAPLAAQTPVGTAFTYQGQLKTDGVSANGPHDVQFRLFTTANGNAQVGSTICIDNLNVSNGLFTVPLDFGAVFDGQKRYLEIDVRSDTGLDCVNTTGYTTLLPRQELTAAPNATFAAAAGSATTAANAVSLNGQPPSFYTNSANLTGTIADARLSSNVARVDANQSFTGASNFSNPGNTFSGTFTGSGAALTNLNAANLTGLVPAASLTGVNGSGLANLNANNLASGIIPAARLTGVGLNASNLSVGSIPAARLSGVSGAGLVSLTAANLVGAVPASSLTGVNGSGLTNVNAASADNALQLGSQPASAYLPPTSWSWFIESNPPLSGSLSVVTTIQNRYHDFSAGSVVANWSTTCYTDVAATAFKFRIRVGNNAGPWTTFYFNQALQHQTISGTAVIPVGTDYVITAFEGLRIAGTGSYFADTGDSLTVSFVNIRQ